VIGSGSLVGRTGYIDKMGRMQVNPEFDTALPLSEALICVTSGEKYGYIDKKGKMVIEPQSIKPTLSVCRALPLVDPGIHAQRWTTSEPLGM
jgi:hypothetical protein